MEIASRNEVVLVGRLSGDPVDKELPSGDVLRTWRLVVDRAPSKRPVPEGQRVSTIDTVDCFAWTAGLLRAAGSWTPGDVLEVHGSLRRRFWHTGGGVQSRTEVEVTKAKRLSRAA
ncbi:MAG: hypothetical protein JWO12_1516 [Frankiales bacterium]|nr:hypothetical protein [Frankiales bacterium]